MKEISSIEYRICAYINDCGLKEGSALPSDQEIANELKCDVKSVAEALDAAARQGKISRQEGAPSLVLSPAAFHEQDEFSFTKSAHVHGETLTTEILERRVRPPCTNDPDDPLAPLAPFEDRAHHALGLNGQEPFIVVARLRRLGGHPRVIHRVYLDPKRFPTTFLEDHDFEKESLIHIYNHYGYVLKSRDTMLTARLPTQNERLNFDIRLFVPILGVEQELIALAPDTPAPFTLEYLQASYVNWHYRIENRPAPSI